MTRTHSRNVVRYLQRQAGFTLIEILVVLCIISVVAGAAVLSIHRNQNKELEAFAGELSQMMTLAEEQAMLQPSVLGLAVHGHSLQFSSLQTREKDGQSTWLPLEDGVLKRSKIPENIEINLDIANQRNALSNDDSENANPQIVISTNGDVTPFTIYVGKRGEQPRYAIIGDADGTITTKPLS